jgi:hypothetical protein
MCDLSIGGYVLFQITAASTTVKGSVLAVTTINKMIGNTVFNVVFRDGSDTIRRSVWGKVDSKLCWQISG